MSTPTSSRATSFADYPFAEEHERIVRELSERGIDCHDTLPAFAGRDPRTLVVAPWDRHFNREGLAIIAEAMRAPVERAIARAR